MKGNRRNLFKAAGITHGVTLGAVKLAPAAREETRAIFYAGRLRDAVQAATIAVTFRVYGMRRMRPAIRLRSSRSRSRFAARMSGQRLVVP